MEQQRREGLSDSQRLLSDHPTSHQVGYHSIPPRSGVRVHPEDNAMTLPTDRYNYVYLIFYMLGLGTLLPWNFFISANDYWIMKLADNSTQPSVVTPPPQPINTSSIDEDSASHYEPNQLQKLFQNTLSVCAMLPNVIFQFLNVMLQQRLPEKLRILTSLLLMIIIFAITAALVMVDVSTWRVEFFIITMVCVVIINSSSAVFQSSMFGMVSCLPPKYMQGFMAGQGMGGLFSALALVVALAAGSNPSTSTLAYFIIAVAILFLTTLCYLSLLRNKFYSHYSNRNLVAIVSGGPSEDSSSPITKSDDDEPMISVNGGEKEVVVNPDVYLKSPDASVNSDRDKQSQLIKANAKPRFREVFQKIQTHCFCVFYTFFITLACYPSITAGVESTSTDIKWSKTYFVPVACFVFFNLFDWTGRSLAGYFHLVSASKLYVLVILVLTRTVFPFLFVLCNVHSHVVPLVFAHDAYFMVFMLLFGLTNGYFSTLAMQYAPACVEPHESTTAGSMLSFALVVGLAAGAGFSFVIKLFI